MIGSLKMFGISCVAEIMLVSDEATVARNYLITNTL